MPEPSCLTSLSTPTVIYIYGTPPRNYVQIYFKKSKNTNIPKNMPKNTANTSKSTKRVGTGRGPPYIYIYTYIHTGWCFGTFFIFPNSWDDDPIWLIFFRRGWNQQPDEDIQLESICSRHRHSQTYQVAVRYSVIQVVYQVSIFHMYWITRLSNKYLLLRAPYWIYW